jgi:hypothetical protein
MRQVGIHARSAARAVWLHTVMACWVCAARRQISSGTDCNLGKLGQDLSCSRVQIQLAKLRKGTRHVEQAHNRCATHTDLKAALARLQSEGGVERTIHTRDIRNVPYPD